jgi:hypothetical protein
LPLNPNFLDRLLQWAVWGCVAIFVVCFIAAFYAQLFVIGRTGALTNRAEDQGLSWGERQGRKVSRFNSFFVGGEFRSLRRLIFGAYTGAAMSFGVLLFLIVLFGERVSP